MKKNIFFIAFRYILFCGIFLLSHNIYGDCKEVAIGANHYKFPFFAAGYSRNSNFMPKKKTWCSVSGVQPKLVFDDQKIDLFDIQQPVMVKFITSHNGDSAGKTFEKNLFPLFFEKCEKGISPADALDILFKDKLLMDFSSDSDVSALTAVFFNDKITLATEGEIIVLLCNKDVVVPLSVKQGGWQNTSWSIPMPYINEISIDTEDTFLILMTPEIGCLPIQNISNTIRHYATPEGICMTIVKDVIKNNKNIEDFACVAVKLVHTSSRQHRETLHKLCEEMKSLLEENKKGTIACISFCQMYKKTCQKLLDFVDSIPKFVAGNQINDLLYDTLGFGFLSFYSAKGRFSWLDDNLRDAFNAYQEVMLTLINSNQFFIFTPKQQLDLEFWAQKVKLYFDWEDKTMLVDDKNSVGWQNDWATFGEKQGGFSLENI